MTIFCRGALVWLLGGVISGGMPLLAQCNQAYSWTVWTQFTPNTATGNITVGPNTYQVSMTANYNFGSTGGIFNYGAFNGFPGAAPNTTVPRTTWAAGPGGVTTMCFSETVHNPVLLLASIGNTGQHVTLGLSRSFVPIYNGGGVTFLSDTTLIGYEGYTILLFPGAFDCITIYSSTPEFYTNLTWGLNPPLFEVDISGDATTCGSATLTASGGQAYQWSGGLQPDQATNTFTTSGTYFLTVTDEYGCQVVTSQDVDLNAGLVETNESISICQGNNYEGYTSTGIYTDTIPLAGSCDSVRTLYLTVLPPDTSTLVHNLCQGGIYEGYNQAGIYQDLFTNSRGCDSLRILDLRIIPADTTLTEQQICAGESYEGYSQSGIYYDLFTDSRGCDSVRMLQLLVLLTDTILTEQQICAGESYEGYTQTGIFYDVFTDSQGCDSVRMLQLLVAPADTSLLQQQICAGENYEGYSQSGVYYDVFTDSRGCDSVRMLVLQVIPAIQSSLTLQLCAGDSYQGYTETGMYTDTFTSATGCDSIRVLNLTVSAFTESQLDIRICEGEIYENYNSSGLYIDTLVSVMGCDSIRRLRLEVLPPNRTAVNADICQGRTYDSYSQAGLYTDVFTDRNGCDSIRSLQLTVHPNYQQTTNLVLCEGERYPFNDFVIEAAGIYSDTVASRYGCDSILNLSVSVVPAQFLPNDTLLCSTGPLELRSPYPNTRWFNGYVGSAVTVETAGTYTATLLGPEGCQPIDTIRVVMGTKIYVPNAFSPNADGVNDCFRPYFSDEGLPGYQFQIYDRWGNQLFATDKPEDCWNGQAGADMHNAGVYTYILRYETEGCGKQTLAGEVHLVR